MHCPPVLTFVVTYTVTFAKTGQHAINFYGKKTEFLFLVFPYFRVMPGRFASDGLVL